MHASRVILQQRGFRHGNLRGKHFAGAAGLVFGFILGKSQSAGCGIDGKYFMTESAQCRGDLPGARDRHVAFLAGTAE
jgi:hypothetical protein